MKCATSLKAQFFLGTFLAEGFLLILYNYVVPVVGCFICIEEVAFAPPPPEMGTI